ncbi:rust resistance kinase Lr10-like [Pistacia vera]|uniref:rust resistance kinase Lr10-like n=1 Tax=Pistacia vera TaxID=55513 RepID=UPI001263D665|nr:rust resistance kinase Lr10-like [Pistacia vera]
MILGVYTILFLLLPFSGAKYSSGGNTDQNKYEFCKPTRCSQTEPTIRFPFRLRNNQSRSCGLEGFELSCFNNKTQLKLPFTGDYYVQKIDYLHSTISFMDVHETPRSLQNLHCANLSNFKFFLSNFNTSDYTIVYCSKMIEDSQYVVGEIDCNRNESDFVYAISATELMDNLPSNCIVNQTVKSSG